MVLPNSASRQDRFSARGGNQSPHVLYSMLNDDGSLGRTKGPWWQRIWLAVCWIFSSAYARILLLFGIRRPRKSSPSVTVEEAEEAYELEEDDETLPAIADNDQSTSDGGENFARSKSDGAPLGRNKDKRGRGTSLFSKVKRNVEERLETMRNSDSAKRMTSGSPSTSGVASSSGMTSSNSSFDRLITKGIRTRKPKYSLPAEVENLNERGDRLEGADDATERLAESTRNYAETSSALLQKYQKKRGFFG
ncbi:unnamed protein product, partial [Mesorhabditis spiculigera]